MERATEDTENAERRAGNQPQTATDGHRPNRRHSLSVLVRVRPRRKSLLCLLCVLCGALFSTLTFCNFSFDPRKIRARIIASIDVRSAGRSVVSSDPSCAREGVRGMDSPAAASRGSTKTGVPVRSKRFDRSKLASSHPENEAATVGQGHEPSRPSAVPAAASLAKKWR